MKNSNYDLNELLIFLGVLMVGKTIRDEKYNAKKANELICTNAMILKCDEKSFKRYVLYYLSICKFNKEINNDFPKLLNHLIIYTKFSPKGIVNLVNYINNEKHNIELIIHLISMKGSKHEKKELQNN